MRTKGEDKNITRAYERRGKDAYLFIVLFLTVFHWPDNITTLYNSGLPVRGEEKKKEDQNGMINKEEKKIRE